MITEHEVIELYGCPLFTRIRVSAPVQEEIPIPSEACFAYITEGTGQRLSTDGSLMALPGQVILSMCGSMVGKQLTQEPKSEITTIVVHFQRKVLQKVYAQSKPAYWKELQKPVVKLIVQSAASELVKQYFEGLKHIFKYEEGLSEELLVLKLKEIVLLLLRTEKSEAMSQIMRSLFSEKTFSFKEVIEANICEPASLERLAALTHHSLTSFKKEFKRIYNTTPGAYMIEKRVERVAQLLEYSEDSISGIGYECGFASPAHLSRVFKDKYGISPTEYRLQTTVVKASEKVRPV